MKKLKSFWQNNSILFVLGFILIVCLIAITFVVLIYFVGDSNSKLGDRLDGIENHPFTEVEQNDFKEKFKELAKEDEIVDIKVQVSQTRTIYVTVEFANKVTLTEAKSKCLTSLENFDENVLNYYDIEFNIKAEASEKTSGYNESGSHNVNGTGGIVWNNGTEFSVDEDE